MKTDRAGAQLAPIGVSIRIYLDALLVPWFFYYQYHTAFIAVMLQLLSLVLLLLVFV